MDVDLSQDGSSSQSDTQERVTSFPAPPENLGREAAQSAEPSQAQVAAAIAELDKMEKFKFQGKEWTPKDLEKAMLRQSDYTKKTQELAEQRKAFEKEQRFAEALAYDLEYVRKNPTQASINEFISIYPEKYHGHLKKVIEELQSGQTQETAQPKSQPQSSYDLQTAADIKQMKEFIHKQEVAKNTSMINGWVDKYSKLVENPKSRALATKIAIANVFEAHNQGTEVTEAMFEDAFKSVAAELKEAVSGEYKELVTKQTQANAKARDVDPGGGTVGRAPAKMSFAQATQAAIKHLSQKEA